MSFQSDLHCTFTPFTKQIKLCVRLRYETSFPQFGLPCLCYELTSLKIEHESFFLARFLYARRLRRLFFFNNQQKSQQTIFKHFLRLYFVSLSLSLIILFNSRSYKEKLPKRYLVNRNRPFDGGILWKRLADIFSNLADKNTKRGFAVSPMHWVQISKGILNFFCLV